ncbi:MAG: hypothetical protein AB7C90_05120 [Bacteroidales bacterium]
MSKILRVQVLREMDIKETPYGKQVVFSIKFIKKNGEIVFLPRAVACGLRMNMSLTRFRGVLPVNDKGEPAGHVYPVNIDNIIEFNSNTVKL